MPTAAEKSWHHAGKLADLRSDEARVVMVGDRQIAVCRIGERLFAFDNICSHEYACLSDGLIEDEEIECPLHQARFHMATGKALTEPACVDLETFDVRVDGEDVLVQVGPK